MPDLTDLLPSIDGPHDPDLTRQIAALLPAVVRWLNHATGNHRGSALAEPADVDTITGNLEAMAALLPQLHGQLAAWLQDENAAGRIRIDASSNATPTDAVTEVGLAFFDANEAAGRLQPAYTQAHRFTNTMGQPYA